jgi:hypothetical protein
MMIANAVTSNAAYAHIRKKMSRVLAKIVPKTEPVIKACFTRPQQQQSVDRQGRHAADHPIAWEKAERNRENSD